MILVDSLLYKIDQRLNKLASNSHQEIPLENKILALNEAQILLIKQKVSGIGSPSRIGMDAFKKRYEDVQGIVVNYENNSLELTETNKKLNEWSSELSSLSPKYFLYMDGYVIANKGKCRNKVIQLNPDPVKHGSIQTLLNNEHYKPSFEYRETFCSISSDKISVYTDGTFTPLKLHVMYIRYPQKIDKQGYVNFDGSDSADQNCELPEHLEDELLNLAVEHLAMDTENASAMQSSKLRAATQE